MAARDDYGDDGLRGRIGSSVGKFIPNKLAAVVIGAVVVIFGGGAMTQVLETIDAKHITVIQAPLSGDLAVYTEPQMAWQNFGKVTDYNRRTQYSFSSKSDVGKAADESIHVTFNDGGSANVSGVVSWEMPLGKEAVKRIHKEFASQQAIEQQLIRPAIEQALYLTAPLMSSTESYAARKAEFLAAFEDQARNGIYKTETRQVRQPDAISGLEKVVSITSIVRGEGGLPVRQNISPLTNFEIKLLSPTVDRIKYDDTVQKQINQQQEAVAQIQTAQAKAREAEQRAITAEKDGQANAATAKWKQEAIKATEVTRSQQEKEVAEINANKEKVVALTNANRDKEVADLKKQAAAFTKQEQVLLGEGEATRKKLVMEADGALEKKLEAFVTVATVNANAIKDMKQPIVPLITMGGGNPAGGQSSANDFMNMLLVKAAKDLALDPSMNVPVKR